MQNHDNVPLPFFKVYKRFLSFSDYSELFATSSSSSTVNDVLAIIAISAKLQFSNSAKSSVWISSNFTGFRLGKGVEPTLALLPFDVDLKEAITCITTLYLFWLSLTINSSALAGVSAPACSEARDQGD